MQRGPSGIYVPVPSAGETVRALVPDPLPPKVALIFDVELQRLAEQAAVAVGRLDAAAEFLPNPDHFLYTYVRKEAHLSSQIERTQSSFAELLEFETTASPGIPATEDVREVSNYAAALEHGLARIAGGFPLSLRLLKEMHSRLLAHGRGSKLEPGEFRRSQNWIGGKRPGNAAFVPPPADHLVEALSALEKFLHDDPVPTPALVKAALAHAQFETLHPFLDGNGRLGRLLITLILCHEKLLRKPLLYLSLYFKQHRQEYYEQLQQVRLTGDWERWLRFFFQAVIATAGNAADTATRLQRQFESDQQAIAKLGRSAATATRLLSHLQRRPITSIALTARELVLTVPTVTGGFQRLIQMGILRELTGGRYSRLFAYQRYLDILSEGTEPLDPAR